MASRHILQEQNRGEAVGAVKQMVNMAVPAAGQAKSRRALGDIVTIVKLRTLEGKPLPAFTCPVTRSFCAQLLANAQKDAADNKKKPIAVNAAKKKPTVKPKPAPVPENVTVIEISPDTHEDKKAGSSSSRNKKPQSSFTSTLTARSKAACGLNYKPKPANIVDIDAQDFDNELACDREKD